MAKVWPVASVKKAVAKQNSLAPFLSAYNVTDVPLQAALLGGAEALNFAA